MLLAWTSTAFHAIIEVSTIKGDTQMNDYYSCLLAVPNEQKMDFQQAYIDAAHNNGYEVGLESNDFGYAYVYLKDDGKAIPYDQTVAQEAFTTSGIKPMEVDTPNDFIDTQVKYVGDKLYLDFTDREKYPQYNVSGVGELEYASMGKSREIDADDKAKYVEQLRQATTFCTPGPDSLGYTLIQFDEINNNNYDGLIVGEVNRYNETHDNQIQPNGTHWGENAESDAYVCDPEVFEDFKAECIARLEAGDYVRTVDNEYFWEDLTDVKIDTAGLDDQQLNM